MPNFIFPASILTDIFNFVPEEESKGDSKCIDQYIELCIFPKGKGGAENWNLC